MIINVFGNLDKNPDCKNYVFAKIDVCHCHLFHNLAEWDWFTVFLLSPPPMAKLKAPRFGLVGVYLCLCAVWASDDWQHKPTCTGFGELAVATSYSPSAVPVPVGADPACSQHAHPVLCSLQYTVCLRVKPGVLLLNWHIFFLICLLRWERVNLISIISSTYYVTARLLCI